MARRRRGIAVLSARHDLGAMGLHARHQSASQVVYDGGASGIAWKELAWTGDTSVGTEVGRFMEEQVCRISDDLVQPLILYDLSDSG